MTAKPDLEDEILAVLSTCPEPPTGYWISRQIETKWAAEGRRSRFLFWTFPSIVAHGTLYRAMDNLRARGLVTRIATEQPDGIPTLITWVLSR